MIKFKKTQSLTFFRFVAALIVINFHFGKNLTQWSPIFLAGSHMVTFFFVLSGFVMITRYHDGNMIKRVYWYNRFLRIAPAYYLALAICACLTVNDFSISLALSFLFIQSWVPPYPLSINSSAWSLSVEFFFYASFPFIVNFINKWKMPGRECFWIAFILWMITQWVELWAINTNRYAGYPSISHDLIYYHPLSHICSFLIGIAAGKIYYESKETEKISSFIFATLILLIIVCIINNQGIIQANLRILLPFESSFLAPIFGILIYLIPKLPNSITNKLNSKFLILLGDSSYEMYIFQMPIWYILDTYYFHNAINWINYLIYLIVLIAFSISFAKFIQPFFKGATKLIKLQYINNNIN